MKLKKLVAVMLVATMVVCAGCGAAPPKEENGADKSESVSEENQEGDAAKNEESEAPGEAAEPESYAEAPMLKEKVDKGELPSVENRLPEDPLVVPPISEIGEYGGVLRLYAPSTDSFDDLHWVREANWVKTKENCYYEDTDLYGVNMHRAAAIDVNETNTEFVIHMRKGMKWSDGEPVTSEDIRFAAEDVWMNEEMQEWWFSWMADNRPTVTVVDEYTIKFTFQNPAKKFLTDLAGWGSNQGLGIGETPSHYLKQFHIKYNENADEEAKAEGYDDWVKRYDEMANCGDSQTNLDLPTINAWMLKSKTTSQRVYERNPYYWMVDTDGNQLPYIDGYIVTAVSDIEVAKLKLIAGEFDIAGQFLIQLSEYPMMKQNEEAGQYTIQLCKGNATAMPVVAPNMNHKDPVLRELFSTPDFRKALSYAINRDEINQISFGGLAKPMQDIFTICDYFDSSEYLSMYTEYDLEKATELLDGMGLTKDGNGYYLRPDGEPLVINLQTIVEEGWGDSAELIAKHWTDIGVKTQYNPIDRTLFGERNEANELDVWVWQDAAPTEFKAQGDAGQWGLNEKAWDYDKWFKSNGEEGTEPPEEFKEYYQNVQNLANADYGSEEYMDLMKKVWDFRIKDQLYCIGTVGDYPSPMLIKNGLANVGNIDVPFDYWQGQYPEQFYWQDAVRQAELVP